MKSIESIKARKNKEKLVVVTAYDYCTAKIVDDVVDIILVGDSLGMVVLGYENPLSVTIEDMQRHAAAVARGSEQAHVVVDLPVGTYDDEKSALLNAESLIKVGADSVKIENKPEIAKVLVENKIPVVGHIGLTPQTIHEYKVQGKTEDAAHNLLEQAQALESAGCYAIVLECIPLNLAKKITETISIPTIGIGAGVHCDGQVLVSNDMLGLYDKINPKFVKKYASLSENIKAAVKKYVEEVKAKSFPSDQESFH